MRWHALGQLAGMRRHISRVGCTQVADAGRLNRSVHIAVQQLLRKAGNLITVRL